MLSNLMAEWLSEKFQKIKKLLQIKKNRKRSPTILTDNAKSTRKLTKINM
jgi:hypothetical protein